MMKIVYVVPGVMAEEEQIRRRDILRGWAFPGTQADLICVTEGPASIESMYEEYLSIPETAKLIFRMQEEGYDAAVLGCAGDPGLDAMRELTDRMLVVGPGQTSMIAAAMLGHKFSVITPEEKLIPSSYELAFKAGVREKLASVVAVNIPVLDLMTDRSKSLDKIIAGGRRALEEDGADILVLGCMSMGFLNVAEEIEEALGIPVINPSKIGFKMAESLVASQLKHSKKAFGTPVKISSGKVKDLEDLYKKR